MLKITKADIVSNISVKLLLTLWTMDIGGKR